MAVAGLPHIPPVPLVYPSDFAGPHGFPLWVRYCHFFNFLFVTMLIRSGLSILADHPRLYFNDDCTPNSEWIRLTPHQSPARPPVDGQGRRPLSHASHWHARLPAYHRRCARRGTSSTCMASSSAACTSSPCSSPPTSGGVSCPLRPRSSCRHGIPGSTTPRFICLPSPTVFTATTRLQQIAYFTVVFVFGPLAILTGIAMSPAVVNHFTWYAKLFGGRQSARSIHFLTMLSFLAFLVVHITLVVMTGFARNMNHIVLGTNDQGRLGVWLGFVGIGVVVLCWIAAHYLSWFQPRALQHALKFVTYPMQLLTLNRLMPQQTYSEKDISPYMWPNGKLPVRDDWKHLAEGHFRDFKLKVGGLVENPVELSLADLRNLGELEHIAMHHCIQGWSGIAKWGGIPMKKLIDLVRPSPEAHTVAFYSFGEALYGGPYYDTQSLENVLKPQCLLASEMNGQPLPEVYGAPLRLRVENQLGYKMVKWIERIEFVESEKKLGKGEGGKNEDDEYFDLLPNI